MIKGLFRGGKLVWLPSAGYFFSKMKLINYILYFSIFILCSCNHGHRGHIEINNSSSDTLIVKYAQDDGRFDTISTLLFPDQRVQVDFSGRSNARKDFCCPCEYAYLNIYPTNKSKILIKDIKNQINWVYTKKDLRAFKPDEIHCTLEINQSDIQ